MAKIVIRWLESSWNRVFESGISKRVEVDSDNS